MKNEILITNPQFDWCKDRNYVESNIIQKHINCDYINSGNNFSITDEYSKVILKPLFDIFFSIAKEGFDLKEKHPNYKYWSYVSNKDRNVSILHDHKKTATANGIFYFKLPQTKEIAEGGLLIKKSYNFLSKEKIFKFSEGNLVIFSGSFPHRPLPIYTEDYRISINIEAI